jgi:malonyl-CoA O-methyltransferase
LTEGLDIKAHSVDILGVKLEPGSEQYFDLMKEIFKSTSVMSRVRTTFNKASAKYNDNAYLQNEIATRLAEKLNVVTIKPKIIADLGSGTGFLSTKVAKKYPDSKLVCIDFAQQSLLTNTHKSRVCADAYQLPLADNSVDFLSLI